MAGGKSIGSWGIRPNSMIRCPCSKLEMVEKFQDFFGLRSFEQGHVTLRRGAAMRAGFLAGM